MALLNRRKWLQKSLLASSALLIGGRASAMIEADPWMEFADDQTLLLNSNENPDGPSPKVIQAIAKSLRQINRYPMAEIGQLKEKIAAKVNLSSDEVLVTAGSTEVLSLLGQHVGLQKGEILIPWPSFPTMVRFGEACGASVRKVPLGKGQHIDLQLLLESITKDTTLVYVCNPNNPTSLEINPEELRSFCQQVPQNVLICIDEAYIEYTKAGAKSSMAPLIKALPNLIVCRTFSKAYGLAGLRIGYALSHAKNIQAIRRRHTGWELSTGFPPIIGAMTALDDPDFIKMCVERNVKGRQILYKAFDKWEVAYNESATNFVYASTKRFGEDIATKLREKNVLVSKWRNIMDGHLRISISKASEMQQFVEIAGQMLT